MNMTAFLNQYKPPVMPLPLTKRPPAASGVMGWNDTINDRPAPVGKVIPIGQRNSTLSHKAGQLLKRYGAEDGRALEEFKKYVAKCEQPLDAKELSTIWNSAMKFFHGVIAVSPDYLPPDQYAAQEFADDLIPEHYTDVGQAKRLAALYGDKLRYSDATLWMTYDGARWAENSPAARGLVHDLTERQLTQAREMVTAATDALLKAQEQDDKAATEQAKGDKQFAEDYHKFARKYQHSSRISATLTEATPYLQINVDRLDGDAFLLNTPAGTVDLRSGVMRPHDPEDYCTKLTGCSPGGDGKEMFLEFLDRVTCGDRQLQDYLQMIAGMFAVGAVYRECLIIAYGSGGNGKSTLFNLLAYVLGDYAGNLSAETLTANCRKNKSPEYAELRGRRLVIAAELEEGMRFDTAIIKKLCSTDPILAEPKYKKPFTFIPSHTVVLYTNHLPRVGTVDKGTWDRLIVVPFKARLRGQQGEILNYARHLYEHAGGAVLQWIIDGAQRFIQAGYRIDLPDCVKAAIDNYRADNDWIHQFLESKCDVGSEYRQASGALYTAYRTYCALSGDYTRSAADFKRAMQDSGFECRKTNAGAIYYGLTLKPSETTAQPPKQTAQDDFILVDELTPWSP